jgi:hypothetical protein
VAHQLRLKRPARIAGHLLTPALDSHMLTKTANLSDAQRILLDKYLRGDFARGVLPQHKADRKREALASLSQEQIWLHSKEATAVPQTYNESITLHHTGALDVGVLEDSLREILRRHEVWRNHFEMRNGQLFQVVGEETEFPLAVIDLSDWPAIDREQEATRVGSAQARQPFDLQKGPLVRATLVWLSDQQQRLYIDMHQMVTDGISVFQILPMELTSLYHSFLAGRTSSLPELSWQFADYAAWQRDLIQGEALQAQLEHWREHIEIGTSPLCWPNDRARPQLETHRARLEPFAFSWESLDELQHTRKRAGASLFAALLATFTALLHSHSGQQDIILGTLAPCGRHRTEFQKLLGYFMNPVPLQFRVSGTDTFGELMLRVQETISGAISHADVPFEHVVKALGVQPLPGRHPLFQIAVSLAPSVPPLPLGWDMTPMDAESGAGRWDLYIEMSERREYLLGRAQYNPDLFEQRGVTALLEDFQKLAKFAGASPHHRISDLLRAAKIGTAEKNS